MQNDPVEPLRRLIRDVPDFPKPGILFKDISPLLADPAALRLCLDLLAAGVAPLEPEAVVGIESRGFIFGAALAARLGLGFVPARKPGKLPAATHRVEYGLEYGTDALELHRDGLRPGERALVVDLAFLGGRAALAPAPTFALLEY